MIYTFMINSLLIHDLYIKKNIIEGIIIDYLNVTERIKQISMLKKN